MILSTPSIPIRVELFTFSKQAGSGQPLSGGQRPSLTSYNDVQANAFLSTCMGGDAISLTCQGHGAYKCPWRRNLQKAEAGPETNG